MLDTVWLCLQALVFFMNLGFAAVETGLASEKLCKHTLEKLYSICSIFAWLLVRLGPYVRDETVLWV